ncbi:hypothetical protein F4779DRAFT_58472 [Xylariaceae sp. FL0662B]|nr:hypothetical protein F4779DRAFT_58472 [Xylariaceae sp. FL0662B]
MSVIFPIENGDQRSILACGIAFSLLSAAFVCMRLLAKRKANRRLDASDYLIILACAVTVVYQGVCISSVLVGGVGFHVSDIEGRFGVESGSTIFNKHLIAIQIFWAVTLGLCKISILHLFARVFVAQGFMIVARITVGLIILWVLTTVLSAFLMCQPLAYNWDKSIDGRCGDAMASWITTGVVNMVIDFIIVSMPMPYLFNLEVALSKKLGLAATFGIGLGTCIVSIARIVMMTQIDYHDITWTIGHTVLFSALEPCIAVILACVLVLRPLFGGRYSSTGTIKRSNPGHRRMSHDSRQFRQLNDDSSETRLRPEELGYRASIAKTPEPSAVFGGMFENGLEMGSISIKQEWMVKEEQRPTTSGSETDKSKKDGQPHHC